MHAKVHHVRTNHRSITRINNRPTNETRTNNESHHSELNTSVDFHDLEESMKSRLIWLVFFFSSLSRELEGFGGWE